MPKHIIGISCHYTNMFCTPTPFTMIFHSSPTFKILLLGTSLFSQKDNTSLFLISQLVFYQIRKGCNLVFLIDSSSVFCISVHHSDLFKIVLSKNKAFWYHMLTLQQFTLGGIRYKQINHYVIDWF
jgi:hypothetical protein